MDYILLQCPVHGYLKVPSPLNLKSSTGSMRGSKMSCPLCGKLSPLVDFDFGFNSKGENVYTFRPTPTTRGQLRALIVKLQATAPTAHDRLITRYQIEEDLQKIDPALATIWKRFKGEDAMAITNYIMALLALMSFMVSCDNRDYSLDEVVEIVREHENAKTAPPEGTVPKTDSPEAPIEPEPTDPSETMDT